MGFEDLDDLSELDEMPPFEDELDIPGFDEPGGGGVNRTFLFIFGLIVVALVIIVILVVILALGGSDELSENERLATANIQTNTAVGAAVLASQTAVQDAIFASQTAIYVYELNATSTQQAFETQAARETQEAHERATTVAYVTETAVAQATLTQQALDATAAAVALANTLAGRLLDPDQQALGGVVITLYQDDQNDVFNPVATPGAVEEGPEDLGQPGETGPEPAQAGTITYGETAEGELTETGQVAAWTFTGAAGDTISFSADAGNPVQMDMYIELVGPDGQVLVTDDDSGEGLNSLVTDYILPTAGEYTIQISSFSGPGAYTLVLLGPAGPVSPEEETEAEEGTPVSFVPLRGGGAPLEQPSERLAQAGDETATPTPGEGEVGGEGAPTAEQQVETATPEPIQPPAATEGAVATPIPPGQGDVVITTITTGTEGEFNFGVLEPGTYWMEIDYDSLPPELQALLPVGQNVTIPVQVPIGAQDTFSIGVTPTATPIATNTPQTTAVTTAPTTPGMGAIFTPTSSPEPGTPLAGSGTPTIPTTGLFSDIADKTSETDVSDSLTILGIFGAGLVAVVFIARKLRRSA